MLTNRFVTLAQEAQKSIKEISVDEFKSLQKSEPNLHIIDVRETEEWNQGHIPGAIHLSKGMIECKIEDLISDPEVKIVLYCGGGYRSALAAENLQKMGYANILSLAGGYGAWKSKK